MMDMGSTDERTLRQQVAACTRLLQSQGILGYSGHVSARLADGSGILVQRFETSRAKLAPEDLLAVDLDGNVIRGPEGGRPPGELVIHTAAMKARPDAGAVLHCHPPTATLFAMVEDAQLVPMKNHAYRWKSGVPVHPDPSHIKTDEQGAAVAATLGEHQACLLRAHGAVLVAEDVPSLMIDAVHFEENAEALIRASAFATPKPLGEDEAAAMGGTFNRQRHVAKLWSYFLGLGREQGIIPDDWDAID